MKLQPGARIAVVAPAGMFAPDRLQRGMEVVASWGFTPVPAPNLYARARHTAGSVAERLADLTWALTAPDIDAVWYARGGFGTAHLLPHLPWDRLDGRPVLGFSDATALHAALLAHGHTSIHAPVLQGLSDDAFGATAAVLVDDDSRQALRTLLTTGEQPALPGHLLLPGPLPPPSPLVGGNLAMLASLAGTPWALHTRGRVLLLEDIGEVPYRLDRLFTQLVQSGALDGVVAVALGEFTDTRVSGADLDAFWAETLAPLGVPVLAGLPVGHGTRNLAFVEGGVVRVSGEGLVGA